MFTINLSKRFIACCFVLFIGISTAFSQTTPQALLSASDIDLFIKSFNPLKEDLEKLGHKYEGMNHNTITAFAANEDVKAVFRKHGWKDDFYPKVSAIVYGYSYLKTIQQIDKMPAEQKQAMEQMMAPMKQQFAALVHKDDIQTVKKKFDVIDQFFQKQ
ncbi:MAG: hypothetical protein ACPGJS_03225 [Flammeovirgaceae bacterium]